MRLRFPLLCGGCFRLKGVGVDCTNKYLEYDDIWATLKVESPMIHVVCLSFFKASGSSQFEIPLLCVLLFFHVAFRESGSYLTALFD